MLPLRNEEIDAVSSLSREARLDHFIKRVLDHGLVWGLQSDGWVVAGNSSGLEIFQVWPFEEYARRCCTGPWQDCVPASMPLDTFIDTFLANLQEQGAAVGVFYTPTDNGLLLPPQHLADLLTDHEDQWYS
jgi:hypothetical protein